jgi:hypothetical protein
MPQAHDFVPESVVGLAGKTVLLLGSGMERWEDYYLTQFGEAGITMVNIDPLYAIGDVRDYPTQLGHRSGRLLAGIGQQLPLRNGSIDAIFSTWSMPLLFWENCEPEDARQQITLLAAEAARVLVPGGAISLAPIENVGQGRDTRTAQKLATKLCFESAGFQTHLVPAFFHHDDHIGIITRLEGIKSGGV